MVRSAEAGRQALGTTELEVVVHLDGTVEMLPPLGRCGWCGGPIEAVPQQQATTWRWRHIERSHDQDHRPVTGDYGTPDPPITYDQESLW